MAFSVVRGGKPIEPEPNWGEEDPEEEDAQSNDAQDAQGARDPAEYDEAFALNQRLKAMLAEAEDQQQAAARGGNSGRGYQQRRGVPKAPAPLGFSGAPAAPSLASRENTQAINRRKYDMKVQSENAGMASRLAGSKSAIGLLPPLGNKTGGQGQESSQSINRRKFAENVQRENAKLVARIEQPARARSWAAPKKVGDNGLPPGWTRGIGGRAMPPPKQRWGKTKSYDAGEMEF